MVCIFSFFANNFTNLLLIMVTFWHKKGKGSSNSASKYQNWKSNSPYYLLVRCVYVREAVEYCNFMKSLCINMFWGNEISQFYSFLIIYFFLTKLFSIQITDIFHYTCTCENILFSIFSCFHMVTLLTENLWHCSRFLISVQHGTQD